MDHLRGQPYDRQEKMLQGIKKLFQEEIYVISARLNLVQRLAPLSSSKAEGSEMPIGTVIEEKSAELAAEKNRPNEISETREGSNGAELEHDEDEIEIQKPRDA